MLDYPNNTLPVSQRALDTDSKDSAATVDCDWRIGDAPLRWDISLTDRIRAAVRQCMSRRVTLGHPAHRNRAA